MMEFINQYAALTVYLFVSNMFLLGLQLVLIYRAMSYFALMRCSIVRCLAVTTGISILLALVGTGFTVREIAINSHYDLNWIMVTMTVSINLVQFLTAAKLYKNAPKGFVLFITVIITICSDWMQTVVIQLISPAYDWVIDNCSYVVKTLMYIGISFAVLFICMMILHLCFRTKLLDAIRILKQHSGVCISASIIILVIKYGTEMINAFIHEEAGEEMSYFSFMLLGGVLLLVFLIMVRWIISDLVHRESRNQLISQQLYIDRMEEVQRKLRSIHHDYKNIASGLYLHAQEGDTGRIKQYVNDRLLNLDREIQLDIQQMNQLVNVRHSELKSLILYKMQKAASGKVVFRLEVMGAVDKVNMLTEDLLRCTGILLDNAVEEASELDDGQVTLAMMPEDGGVTLLVKNTLAHQPDLNRIFEPGYSTKLNDRGLGLHNLKEIVHQYRNIFLETKSEPGSFIQILKIEN